MHAADASERLIAAVDHIVVVMQSGRSFDHMLGHLALRGRPEVNGLRWEMANLDRAGGVHFVHPLTDPAIDPAPPVDAGSDAMQLAHGNRGFVRTYEAAHPATDPGVVMGYLDEATVPVHGFLAREFAVCDAWFASVRGPRGPNRAVALTGRPDPGARTRSVFDLLERRDRTWRWYHSDMATWFPALGRRNGDGPERGGRRLPTPERLRPIAQFAEDARRGRLPDVCWVEPAHHGPQAADDQPPSDVRRGQRFLADVYNALRSGPHDRWAHTLLIVVHDTHGGFFDHVEPPATLGGRVPAVVVSPWIPAGTVCHRCLDHATIARTVLARFCRRPDGTIPDLGPRVAAARHLGELLTLDGPRPTPGLVPVPVAPHGSPEIPFP